MCVSNRDVVNQKFGYQRSEYYTGLTDELKSFSLFGRAVETPTNWRVSYEPQKSKIPVFLRYGSNVPVTPEWFQRNYLGSFPLKQQPIIEEPKPFNVPRFS